MIPRSTDRQRLQESEQLQLPAFIKNAMAQSASWQKKTDDWREQRMVEIRMKQNDTAHRLALCEFQASYKHPPANY